MKTWACCVVDDDGTTNDMCRNSRAKDVLQWQGLLQQHRRIFGPTGCGSIVGEKGGRRRSWQVDVEVWLRGMTMSLPLLDLTLTKA